MFSGTRPGRTHKCNVPLWTAMYQEDITVSLLAEWIGMNRVTLRGKLAEAGMARFLDEDKAAIAKVFAPKYSYEELFPEERK